MPSGPCRGLNIVGKTVEQLGKKAIKKKKNDYQMISKFQEEFEKSINFLIFSGHSQAWNYTYRRYKAACEHAKLFEKKQVLAFTTAIGLAFSGKKAIESYLSTSK